MTRKACFVCPRTKKMVYLSNLSVFQHVCLDVPAVETIIFFYGDCRPRPNWVSVLRVLGPKVISVWLLWHLANLSKNVRSFFAIFYKLLTVYFFSNVCYKLRSFTWHVEAHWMKLSHGNTMKRFSPLISFRTECKTNRSRDINLRLLVPNLKNVWVCSLWDSTKERKNFAVTFF